MYEKYIFIVVILKVHNNRIIYCQTIKIFF
jgi:hypothetical protein